MYIKIYTELYERQKLFIEKFVKNILNIRKRNKEKLVKLFLYK